MDKARIKTLLASYRPNSGDESDPIFREALEEVAQNPELAEWFRAEQDFDAAMIKKFYEVPVDSAPRKRIRDTVKRADGAEDGGKSL